MSATDNKQNPRRYRAKVVRGGSASTERFADPVLSKTDDLTQLRELIEHAEEHSATPKPESVQRSESVEESEPVQEPVRERREDERTHTKVLPQESFDYVVPQQTYKEHHSHKHVSSHRGHTKSATREEIEAEEEGYIFASRRKRKHKHKHKSRRRRKFRHLPLWKRILIIALSFVLVLIIALGGAYLTLNEIGRRSMRTEEIELVPPSRDELGYEIIQVDNSGRVITYEGVSYELNDDLISLTFIGADAGDGDNSHLQMADAIYILTLDTVTGDSKILGVSRDTMTDVDLYSEQGNFIETERRQIAFSYAYGNDKVTGGQNTSTSLSRLFYGLPFKDYFAINMNALITLNDTIGGVTLTSSMTFESPIDGRTISEGETVTLHGKEADYYVRHRDTERLESNNDRMQRQQEYIRAFMSSLIPAAKKDISVITTLYNEIQVNSDSTLDLSKLTYLASTAVSKLNSATDIEYLSLRGEITEGEYAEMNIDNKTTIRTMLDVFYKPLAEVPKNIR